MTKPSKAMSLFRERVREELDRQEKTISQLAVDAGISFVHMSRVLAGKADVSLPVAEQIADAVGVPLSALLDFEKISL